MQLVAAAAGAGGAAGGGGGGGGGSQEPKFAPFPPLSVSTSHETHQQKGKTLPEAQRTQKLTPRLGLNLATTWRHLH